MPSWVRMAWLAATVPKTAHGCPSTLGESQASCPQAGQEADNLSPTETPCPASARRRDARLVTRVGERVDNMKRALSDPALGPAFDFRSDVLDIDAIASLADILVVEFAGTSHLEDILKTSHFDQGLLHAIEVLRRIMQHVHRA